MLKTYILSSQSTQVKSAVRDAQDTPSFPVPKRKKEQDEHALLSGSPEKKIKSSIVLPDLPAPCTKEFQQFLNGIHVQLISAKPKGEWQISHDGRPVFVAGTPAARERSRVVNELLKIEAFLTEVFSYFMKPLFAESRIPLKVELKKNCSDLKIYLLKSPYFRDTLEDFWRDLRRHFTMEGRINFLEMEKFISAFYQMRAKNTNGFPMMRYFQDHVKIYQCIRKNMIGLEKIAKDYLNYIQETIGDEDEYKEEFSSDSESEFEEDSKSDSDKEELAISLDEKFNEEKFIQRLRAKHG